MPWSRYRLSTYGYTSRIVLGRECGVSFFIKIIIRIRQISLDNIDLRMMEYGSTTHGSSSFDLLHVCKSKLSILMRVRWRISAKYLQSVPRLAIKFLVLVIRVDQCFKSHPLIVHPSPSSVLYCVGLQRMISYGMVLPYQCWNVRYQPPHVHGNVNNLKQCNKKCMVLVQGNKCFFSGRRSIGGVCKENCHCNWSIQHWK